MKQYCFTVRKLKNLVRHIQAREVESIKDCLERHHIFLRYHNLYCHVVRFDTGVISLRMYTVTGESLFRLSDWLLPGKERDIVGKNLTRLTLRREVTDGLIEKALSVMQYGWTMKKNTFLKVLRKCGLSRFSGISCC